MSAGKSSDYQKVQWLFELIRALNTLIIQSGKWNKIIWNLQQSSTSFSDVVTWKSPVNSCK